MSTRLFRSSVIAILSLSSLLQTACFRAGTTPRGAQATKPPAQLDFIDLRPGSLRVVMPMLRSGGYVVPSVRNADPKKLEIEAGDDFLGYEKDHYVIRARNDGGIRIEFSRAEVWEKGKTSTRQHPKLRLFSQAANVKHVRLVYLIRVSETDHNMAIVASDDLAALEEATRTVTKNADCQNSERVTCTWVPEGIAVIPEMG